MGWAIGSRFKSDVCSTPDCRELLPPGITRCPKCRGEIAGTVRSTEEHFAESAQVRRELARDAAAGSGGRKGRSEKKAGTKKRARKGRDLPRSAEP